MSETNATNERTQAPGLSRRKFLKTGGLALGGATLLGGGTPPWLQAGAWAGEGGLEKTKLTLGFIPLTDCAPLVVAFEKGYFKKYGLEVALSKEASWANIRDKVSIGELDGAHMLAGMPIAASLGVGALPKATITAFSMDLNGNAVTVSNELYERMVKADPEAMRERPLTARALKKVIDADKAAGKEAMTFAMVFPVSTHNYQLRYWLGSAGINPDQDLRLIVIPPPQMVANLKAGNIAGYCVGEPWNERAVETGIGRVLITSYELWNNNPEKVFSVNLEWHEKNPRTHQALLMALLEATQWMDQPDNRMEVVRLIAQKSYVNAPEDVVKMSMTGTFKYAQNEEPRPLPDFNVFYRYAANFPWQSHAAWFIGQMYRWGQLEQPANILQAAASIYRPDLYRQAAKAVNVPYPTIDVKTEGSHAAGWTLNEATSPIAMGPDRFFDGGLFDPKKLGEYVTGFAVKNLKVAPDALLKANA
ncbi:MAG: CmpA/NrtA family ABC transporter substrate-binding protein [Candidatus Competibacteraceae bacterium]|jgi:ABC-type nitrate/sulfonate/bicarbonate transport system substrate-binding protein